jgi:hypothetical protein
MLYNLPFFPIQSPNQTLFSVTETCPFPFLAKYKNIFGEPGKHTGMRKYRIFDIAILDTMVVFIFAYILSFVDRLSFLYNVIILFILGVISHRIFCVRTTVDKFLFT